MTRCQQKNKKRRKKFSERETEARRQKFKEIYKDLTDAQIADIHEVSIRTVQRWKKGDYDPGVHLKFALSDRMSSYGHFVGDHDHAVRRLRHNFITAALAAGADLKALAEIVGSRPETLTRHYQHVTRSLHRKTIAKIPPLDPDT